MKSPAAYYLMLLYVTVIFKPLIPIMQDIWAHDFNEAEHISVIHAKYGTNHLQKELAENSSENDHNKSHNVLKADDQASSHVLTKVCNLNLSLSRNKDLYLFFNPDKLLFVFISNPAPPPKFS